MESTKHSVANSFSCRLVATKETARQTISAMGENSKTRKWAIYGCSNSCCQPQLAEFSRISRKLIIEESGNQTPRFNLVLRGEQARRGETNQENLTLTEMHKFADGLN